MAAPLLDELAAVAGGESVLHEPDALDRYSRDQSEAEPCAPVAVVRPVDTAAVAAVLAVAHRRGVPVVPAGGRTGLSGGSVPVPGAIALSLERLDRIGPVDRGNLTVAAGAGARTGALAEAARAAGLAYPPDPASLADSTIGGNIAENAGGPRCFKYGVTGDYVLALEAVAADGRVFRTGRATRKSTTGLRLAQLLVGSEGTLAVITEATLRLIPAPLERRAALAAFATPDAAGDAVAAVIRAGLVPSALELLDRHCVELLRAALGGDAVPPAGALLLVEVDGAHAASDLARVVERLGAAGAGAITEAASDAGVEAMWDARRALSAVLLDAAPRWLLQDVCVPVAQIAEALRRIEAAGERTGLRIPVFGHAGDGNLHPSVLHDEGEERQARAAQREILTMALDLGGTVSAEHGIGSLKLPYVDEELDPVALEQMRAIKRALDPQGILNPGKALPTPAPR